MENTTNLQDIIIKEFELERLQKEDKEELANQIGGMIMQTVLVKSLAEMPEEGQEDFDSMLEHEPSVEQIVTFLRAKNSNFEELLIEEIKAFKEGGDEIMDKI